MEMGKPSGRCRTGVECFRRGSPRNPGFNGQPALCDFCFPVRCRLAVASGKNSALAAIPGRSECRIRHRRMAGMTSACVSSSAASGKRNLQEPVLAHPLSQRWLPDARILRSKSTLRAERRPSAAKAIISFCEVPRACFAKESSSLPEIQWILAQLLLPIATCLSTDRQLVKPPALHPGDTIGIVAPASNLKRADLEAGCEALRDAGYKPFYFDSILEHDLYFAGSSSRRTRELEDMFSREDVRAILCARGGYGSNYLLKDSISKSSKRYPKIFIGYSDITSLLTYFVDAAGLVTVSRADGGQRLGACWWR